MIRGYTTEETTGQYDETYVYDRIGNLINKAGQEMAYGDGTAGPHAVTAINEVQAYWYDDNGNMTQKPGPNNGTHTLTWTPENMLKQVVNNGSTTVATFTYDADGMMVLRTENYPGVRDGRYLIRYVEWNTVNPLLLPGAESPG